MPRRAGPTVLRPHASTAVPPPSPHAVSSIHHWSVFLPDLPTIAEPPWAAGQPRSLSLPAGLQRPQPCVGHGQGGGGEGQDSGQESSGARLFPDRTLRCIPSTAGRRSQLARAANDTAAPQPAPLGQKASHGRHAPAPPLQRAPSAPLNLAAAVVREGIISRYSAAYLQSTAPRNVQS